MPGPLTILAGDRALTEHQLTCSNTDPGGYQVMTLKAPGADLVAPDVPIRVMLGADTVFHGLVNEPGAATRDTRADDELAAVGFGARLKDNPFAMIYVDSALKNWKGVGTQRRVNLLAGGYGPVDAQARTDSTTPALATEVTGDWAASAFAISEGWYDAGEGNTIERLYYAWTKGSSVDHTLAGWSWKAFLLDDDTAAVYNGTAELKAAGPGSGVLSATTATRRYALAQMLYAAAGGDAGKPYTIDWTSLGVFGPHRLALRGTASATQGYGLYPGDIWTDALKRSGAGILPGRVDDTSGYIVRQAVYREAPATGAEQIMGDMAKVLGWHTGVWAPASVLDDTPRADLCPPPPETTCVVYRRGCDDFNSPKIRRDTLYTRAEVRYTDVAGSSGVETVELPSDLIDGDRTLQVNMGTGSSAAAQAYGRFALLLARDSAKGGGSCVVGDTVHLPGGGRKPAMLLRAGHDRIQIPDLPDSGPMTGQRRDTFLVRRVETTIASGRAQTRIEFDGGADLMEVLQARMAGALEAANL